ncbi:MAG: hypothetical protein ACI30K_06300 [Muribaculaceae bacterium]
MQYIKHTLMLIAAVVALNSCSSSQDEPKSTNTGADSLTPVGIFEPADTTLTSTAHDFTLKIMPTTSADITRKWHISDIHIYDNNTKAFVTSDVPTDGQSISCDWISFAQVVEADSDIPALRVVVKPNDGGVGRAVRLTVAGPTTGWSWAHLYVYQQGE